MVNADSPRALPPVAERREVELELHGDRRVDAYGWLRQSEQAEALAYLTAERQYYDAATAHLKPVASELADAMAARLPDEEWSVSHPRERYRYLDHVAPGSDYTRLCRIPLTDAEESASVVEGLEVLLDLNELIGASAYGELGVTLVSPDERLLAYSVDTTGDEVYALRFRDLESRDKPFDLDDVIERSYYSGAWSADSRTFFYTVHDQAYRPHQVWRHRIGTSAADDVLVLAEDDEQYELDVRATRSGDLVVIHSANRDTSEVWLVDAHHPEQPARVVEPRRRGVEYACEHVRTPAGDRLFIVTNDGAQEFRLMTAPLDDPGRGGWGPLVPEDPAERLYGVTAFATHVVTTLRRDTVLMARSYRITEDGGLADAVDLAPSSPVGTLELAANEQFNASEVQVVEQSWTHPRRWYAVDLSSGARRHLLTQPVPSYDEDNYVSERVYAPAGGKQVPVTVVRHVDTPLDGTAPCLLYGYGAYEACFDPEFDATLTALLDRGVIWAHAGIRGGGEGGRRWWLDGRLANKQNTYSDHIAAADFLADGLVDGQRIVTRGLSAGGMLQGAVFSQAPHRWAGVIAEVPAVDILNSMLDPSIPLTINEWDEWGDPREPEQYRWLRAYSPYDNIPPAGVRPDLLVTGALHDPRVMVSEPTKWVAELRYTDPDWSPQCVYRVELGEGAHAGPSGRFAHVRYEADIYAWALERFGLTSQ